MDARALYQAVIVEHDRHPRNAGPLPDATHHATADNPLCGDEVTLHVALAGDTLAALGFEARGCALTRAAASLLTERARGLDRAAARALAARFERFVAGTDARATGTDATAVTEDDTAALGELTAFAGVRAFRSRRACATLPFRALVAALDRDP